MELEDYEKLIYRAMEEGKIFNCGDGIRGKIDRIVRFKYADGIDYVIIRPFRNASYRKEKQLLGDDWDLSVYDICEPFYFNQLVKE
jgi:hypothetical protein